MVRADLSVVVPCYNEQGNIPELVERTAATLDELGISWEIVLVDDGSTDGTWDRIETARAADPRVIAVRHEVNQGMVAGWRSGLAAASGFFICITDADLQYQPEDIGRLWREIRFKNVDVVQGTRTTLTRARDRRFYLSRGLNYLLNVLFRMRSRDNKSGFLITRRHVFADIVGHRFRYRYFQTFILVSAATKGYSLAEIDTVFADREVGESFVSKTPYKIVFNSLLDLAKGVVEFRLLRRVDRSLERFLAAHPPVREPKPLGLGRRWWLRLYFWLMPLHHWMITAAARSYLRFLERSQYLSPEDVRRYQEQRLRRLVDHAYYNVSHYRLAMDRAGVKPEDVATLDDLGKLPLLSKEQCRRRLYNGLLANGLKPAELLRVTTSGSTGEPFVCYADRRQLEFRFAATLRSMAWTGYRFGDRQVRLWHQTIGMTRWQVVKERLDAILCRRAFVPVFEIREANVRRMLRRIRRIRPVLIDGYAEALNLLAAFAGGDGSGGRLPTRGIISSAQTLPDASRAAIESAFGCRVFDKYGSREFSGIAYECEAHDGHHVVAESYIVEVLRDHRPAAPGEIGEVVITDLNNFSMPFIRYRIGDLAVAMDPGVPCPCGRGLPRVGSIEGRVQSIVVGADGRLVPGALFSHLLKDYETVVRRFQVVQRERGAIEFKVIKGGRFTPERFEEILRQLRSRLGAELRIDVRFVDEIPLVRTGKHSAVISELGLDFQRVSSWPARH